MASPILLDLYIWFDPIYTNHQFWCNDLIPQCCWCLCQDTPENSKDEVIFVLGYFAFFFFVKLTYLPAVFQNFNFVLSACGFVIEIGDPLSVSVDILVMEKATQIVTLFFWADHGHHWFMMLGWISRLKQESKFEINR